MPLLILAPQTSKRQLLSSTKTPLQGVEDKDTSNREDGQIKTKEKETYNNLTLNLMSFILERA